MTRKKVNLTWIENEAARKASMRKRCAWIMQKVSELTTLCGVPGMCLIYGPREEHPMVWPSHEVAEQMLMRFLSLSEIERSKKMTSQEGYLRNAILKAQENQRKELQKLRNMELTWLMNEVHHGKGLDKLEAFQLNCLAWLIQEKIQEIRKRIKFVGSNSQGRAKEREEDEDRKSDLHLDNVEIMNRNIVEIEQRHSGVVTRDLLVWLNGGEDGSWSGCLGAVETELRLGRDGNDVGSRSMETRKTPLDDGCRLEMELFRGGGGGGSSSFDVEEAAEGVGTGDDERQAVEQGIRTES